MGAKTGIEWTDATWNPIRGCSRVSEGCRNCYAEKIAYRFSGAGKPYEGLAVLKNGHASWTGKVEFVEKHLLDPLKWKLVDELIPGAEGPEGQRAKAPTRGRRRRIFVNSMSDLFHENVPDEWIDKIFAVMLACPQHVFQVLTKRPERMREYMRAATANTLGVYYTSIFECLEKPEPSMPDVWPLPNVWLGVSVENQKAADERIPLLLQTPAAVRFISAEPLLGPIDFDSTHESDPISSNFLTGIDGERVYDGSKVALDWVICGGESGPGARPMHPDWARSLRDQCQSAGVPFFFKQWGEWAQRGGTDGDAPRIRLTDLGENGQDLAAKGDNHVWMERRGKHSAGHLLDGREWHEFPEVR